MTYIAQHNMVVVKPDLPVDKTTSSGIYLPAQAKADHSMRDDTGYVKRFGDGEFQVISGTVLASGDCDFAANMPTAVAEKLGLRNRMYQNGLSECNVKVRPPQPGDRVWFGWRTWSAIEANGMVAFDDDDNMVGNMESGSIYLVEHAGEYRAMGPYLICEPIPEPVPSDSGIISGMELSHIGNAAIVRYVGDVSHLPNCAGIKPGDTISYGRRDKTGCPVPFGSMEWCKVQGELVTMVNPSWVRVPEDLEAAWGALEAYNVALPKNLRIHEDLGLNPLYDRDMNKIDYLAELEKKRIKEFKKMYRSKWF